MRDSLETRRQIAQTPGAYEFYAALRLLECSNLDKPRIGESARPADDIVRFAQEASQAFAPSALAALETASGSQSADRLLVRFFGLLGPNGPMPGHITDHVRDRSRNFGDHATARFFDMFHHRMIALLYRAWAAAQPTVSLDRSESSRFSQYVASLVGMGQPGMQARDSVPDLAKWYFSGHLAGHSRNAAGLQSVLTRFFKLPVKLQQFVGHWIKLPVSERCQLSSGFGAQALGVSTVIGERVYNAQGKFRLIIGPLDHEQYLSFLPGAERLKRLISWVRNYVGDEFEWDVRLILKRDDVPSLQLNGTSRLGQTSWLTQSAFTRDADDLVFNAVRYYGNYQDD